MTKLGLCFRYGFGVEQDSKKALELSAGAKRLGSRYAAVLLGLCY